jgi:hypothetical protein
MRVPNSTPQPLVTFIRQTDDDSNSAAGIAVVTVTK